MIQFLLNDEVVTIEQERADLTVLKYLREKRNLTGTKEGCASGDCGACTIVTADLDEHGQAQYRAINSCVTFMSALHGKQVLTVEHLAEHHELHPVQQAMVENNGSQCGFCTPGFIMSMFALYKQSESKARSDQITRIDAINALSGNLCRCTGYQPIIDATLQACNQAHADKFTAKWLHHAEQLTAIKSSPNHVGTANLFIPDSRESLMQAMHANPDAMLVAGSTDLALMHTQQLKPLAKMISLHAVQALKRISTSDKMLTIGAACTLNEAKETLLSHFPALSEVIERFASMPIRNQATIGGNVANASPIGDMPPVLIALDAELTLDNGKRYRTLPIKEFFTAYKKTVLENDEWIDSISIPLPEPNQVLRVYKVSKRNEDDISAVCMAINMNIDNNFTVTAVSTGFGGVAAVPASCNELESVMLNRLWSSKDCLKLGKQILAESFTPIDDVRASGEYRTELLQNLWHRFWLESNSNLNKIETRVCHDA